MMHAWSLDRLDIVSGVEPERERVLACGKRHGVSGRLVIKITIEGTGTVTRAATLGAFAGRPVGMCAEEAVRAARFRVFDGPPVSVDYPFVLP